MLQYKKKEEEERQVVVVEEEDLVRLCICFPSSYKD